MIDVSKIEKTENTLDPASLVAQLRIKQGLGYEYKPQQGQMIGNVYVGANPMQHLAEALRGGMAGYEEAKGMQDLVDIQAKKNAQSQQGMNQYVNLLRGTPEQRIETPQQVMVAGDGANDGEMAQGTVTNVRPAVAPNPQAAQAYALASNNPFLKQLALNQMEKEPEIQARKDDKESQRQFQERMIQMQIEARKEAAAAAAANRPERQAQIIDTDQGKMRVMPNGTLAPLMDVSGNAISGPKGPQGTLARQNEAQQALAAIKQAETILPKATSSGIGSLVDSAAGFVGYSTPGAQAASQLRALEGELISKMPKMSGPQSDKDVALYKQMAGVVGDATQPVATRQAALQTVKEIQQRYAGPAMNLGATGNPNSVMNQRPAGGVVDFGSLK